MRQAGRWAAGGLTLAMILTGGAAATAAPGAGAAPNAGSAPGAAAGAPGAAAGAPGAAAPGSRTVTLLTGDRVTVQRDRAAAVRPGPGRAGIRFAVRTDRGRLTVVPSDAIPLLRDGTLDRRLFDVTGLIEVGYDDRGTDAVPLLLTYRPGAARRAAAPTGVRVTRDLPAIGGVAASVDKARAATAWTALTAGAPGARTATTGGVGHIWLDGRRTASLDRSVAQIGAPAAYAAGFTGQGVTIALLDSGVDLAHPDLAGVADAVSFVEGAGPQDEDGHGTHVASTIAGSGAASAGRYRGVAPDATLVSGKVCEFFCEESSILAGMQWAAVDKSARVINMSLGGFDTPEVDPLEEAIDTLTEQTGALFVVAAGNDGPGAGSVSSPSTADAALSVGAVDRDDSVADFSGRGPRTGDAGLKPEITAPGVEIVAAALGGGYVAGTGTSMATPHVTGAAALLAQQHPDWTAGALKAALTASANPTAGADPFQQGAGRVDVARAITQTVTSEPVGVSFGRAEWPHDDDVPVARTVTYRNSGAAAVTLALTVEATGPAGEPAPAGVFTLSATSVTVPAGGTAAVTVTADTSTGTPDGTYGGRVLATAGDLQVTTPIAVEQEVESYDLTLTHLGFTGEPTGAFFTAVLGLDTPSWTDVFGEGTVTVRLPKGAYGIANVTFPEDPEATTAALLGAPRIVLDRDLALTVDASRAAPVSLRVPARGAAELFADATAVWQDEEFSYSFGLGTATFADLTAGRIGGAVRVPADAFAAWFAGQWAHPTAEFSPYLYAATSSVRGRMPVGYDRTFRAREFATVTEEIRPAPAGQHVERVTFPETGWPMFVTGAILPTGNPGRRVNHLSTGEGVSWLGFTDFGTPSEEGFLDLDSSLFAEPVRYRAGKHYRVVWNAAPYGPVFPGAFREGDTIVLAISVHGDRAGHYGFAVNTGRTALYRDGELVGESPEAGFGVFEVPAGPGRYRLETVARRPAGTELSTEIGAVWRFRAPAGGPELVELPAPVVRFLPKLAADHSAPAGKRFAVPVTVVRAAGTPAVRSLAVEVSYDDGRTWRAAPVRGKRDTWVATLRHPAGGGYVSLRATALDRAGNAVTQHVVRAYRLR